MQEQREKRIPALDKEGTTNTEGASDPGLDDKTKSEDPPSSADPELGWFLKNFERYHTRFKLGLALAVQFLLVLTLGVLVHGAIQPGSESDAGQSVLEDRENTPEEHKNASGLQSEEPLGIKQQEQAPHETALETRECECLASETELREETNRETLESEAGKSKKLTFWELALLALLMLSAVYLSKKSFRKSETVKSCWVTLVMTAGSLLLIIEHMIFYRSHIEVVFDFGAAAVFLGILVAMFGSPIWFIIQEKDEWIVRGRKVSSDLEEIEDTAKSIKGQLEDRKATISQKNKSKEASGNVSESMKRIQGNYNELIADSLPVRVRCALASVVLVLSTSAVSLTLILSLVDVRPSLTFTTYETIFQILVLLSLGSMSTKLHEAIEEIRKLLEALAEITKKSKNAEEAMKEIIDNTEKLKKPRKQEG